MNLFADLLKLQIVLAFDHAISAESRSVVRPEKSRTTAISSHNRLFGNPSMAKAAPADDGFSIHCFLEENLITVFRELQNACGERNGCVPHRQTTPCQM
jgi:hypothetical protein